VSRTQWQWLGLATMALSMAAFFWWGVHFHVFGSAIDFGRRPVELGGFFGWILVMTFGLGLTRGGLVPGFKAAAVFVALGAIAALIGFLRGAYG